MFKFINSDYNPNALKGRLMVFFENIHDVYNYPACIVTSSISDAVSSLRNAGLVSDSNLEKIIEAEKRLEEEKKKKKEKNKKIIDKNMKKYMDILGFTGKVGDEKDYTDSGHVLLLTSIKDPWKQKDNFSGMDVLCGGLVTTFYEAEFKGNPLAMVYFDNYELQCSRNGGKILSPVNKKLIGSYFMFSREDLERKYSKYVTELMDAIKGKRKLEASMIVNDMKQLSYNSPFSNDITEVINTAPKLVKAAEFDKNTVDNLVYDYIKHIGCLKQEEEYMNEQKFEYMPKLIKEKKEIEMKICEHLKELDE